MDVAPLNQSQADEIPPEKETSFLNGFKEQLEYKVESALIDMFGVLCNSTLDLI
jgi:hypothetical protein